MIETNYYIRPESKKFIIGIPVVIFLLIMFLSPLWWGLINYLFDTIIGSELPDNIIITFLIAIIFTFLLASPFINFMSPYFGWYKFQYLKAEKILYLEYRNKIGEEYEQISFNLDETIIRTLGTLLWFTYFSNSRLISLVLPSPSELRNMNFYDQLADFVETHTEQIEEEFKNMTLADIDEVYLLFEGDIKKMGPEFFDLIGLTELFTSDKPKTDEPELADQVIEQKERPSDEEFIQKLFEANNVQAIPEQDHK